MPNGTFAPGNSAAKNRRRPNWREALRQAITTEDIKDVWISVTNAAKGGDMRAAGLFLSYVCGRPREIDPEDVEERDDVPNRWEFC